MGNLLRNPTLTGLSLAAVFNNNGVDGVIHVPDEWIYVYQADGQLRTVERLAPGDQPRWLRERPPQVQPPNPFEQGTYIETTSYSGLGGFRQSLNVQARQRYVCRAVVTVFVVANEAASQGVRLQMRIYHQDGIAANDWYFVPVPRFRQPFEILQPVIEPEFDGAIAFEGVAEIRFPLVSVKVVLHELFVNEVAADYGQPIRIRPFGQGQPQPDPLPNPTPTPLPIPSPSPPVAPTPVGCRNLPVVVARRLAGRSG